MKYLFSPSSLPALAAFARERALCAFDFDGTLAPIVDHPDHARMRATTRRRLTRVASLYPTIVISGRARADVLEKVKGTGLQRVFGNHGAEDERPMGSARRLVTKWNAALQTAISDLPGVWIENKGVSLAVHYRQAKRQAAARQRILDAAGGLEQARMVGGKRVVNLVIEGAPQKGEALAAVRDGLRCSAVLFVGDDDNDEDAFALEGHTVAVRVGRKRQSNAQYYIRTQAEIDRLLQILVELRKTPGSA